MAEVKNAFIKSKMNKDLDSRLLPSGEYRNALNAQVSKSEGSDVGALENVLGNKQVSDFGLSISNLSSIGYLSDEANSMIYVFLTDNDTNDYIPTGAGSNHYVVSYNATNDTSSTLVKGAFLNFSKLNPIFGVNLLENLLFWTDNRNQPRKINVISATESAGSVMNVGLSAIGSGYINSVYNTQNQVPGGVGKGLTVSVTTIGGTINSVTVVNPGNGYAVGDLVNILGPGPGIQAVISISSVFYYYTSEDNISVAKYNPYEAIELYESSALSPGDYESTMKDVFSIAYPDGGTALVNGDQSGTSINIDQTNIPVGGKPVTGQSVSKINATGEVTDLGVTVIVGSSSTVLNVSSSISVTDDEELVFDANPYYIPNYKGDPKFLEDKFVRFSYRFKFNDGEHSIQAPFTQPCFIPKQDGYFLNNTPTEGDEQQAYSSTIIDFMENKVNKIDLKIPLPSSVVNLSNSLHIEEIDILYKESDGLAVQVVETLSNTNNFGTSEADSLLDVLTYEYESQIPYKTLPSDEITRVYDKVPVKAFSQEIISNRIVYGNYQNKHTPPALLNYNVTSSEKSDFNLNKGSAQTSGGSFAAGASITIYNASGSIVVGSLLSSLYPDDSIPIGTRVVTTDGSTTMTLNKDVGLSSSILIDFNLSGNVSDSTSKVEYPSSNLKTNRNYQVGFVLSDKFGRQSSVILASNSENTYNFSVSTAFSPYIDEGTNTYDWMGNSLKVLVNDPISPQSPNPVTNEPGIYNGDASSDDYNPLGWYSYKIVVKQVEQEYYNVYSAGAMKGLPYNYDTNNITPVLSENTSFITLLNDNINKIPRDLSEVGPQDKAFRSSVELYGRVQNTSTSNEQFYPGRRSFTTSSVEDLFGLFDVQDFKGRFDEVIPITNPLNAFHGFFKSDSDPFIAEISTSQNSGLQFGVNNSYTAVAGSGLSTTTASSQLTVALSTITGSIHVGSLLISIEGQPAITDTYVVSTSADGTNLDVTFNKNVSHGNGKLFTFSQQDFNDINTLAIFETAPVESRLDIFWETSSSGLITDLNNLVLNSTTAGAGFSSWNDEPFAENSVLNSNVLNTNFTLVDNLGNAIIFASGDTFVLNSVLDNESPTPSNVTHWFELYEVTANTNIYNIKVTQAFVDEAWYSSTNGTNDFNFSFTSVIDGVTTNYNQTASLSNADPIMSGPNNNGTTPTPAINYSTNNSTLPSDIGTFTAVNGANTAGNQGKDITWSITATKGGVDYGSSFGVTVTSTDTLSTCVLKNVNTSGVPTGVYTLKLKCIDAGQAFQEIIITAQLGIIPIRVTDYGLWFNDQTPANPSFAFASVCLIEVDNNPDPGGTDGFYAINGSWNSISNGVTVVNLKQSNDLQGGTWYYSNVSRAAALTNWKSSFTNDFPQYWSPDSARTSAAVNNSSTIPVDNVSNPLASSGTLNNEAMSGLRISGPGISPGTTILSVSAPNITVSSNQTVDDNVDLLIGDIPLSTYSNYTFEVIT